MTPDRPGHEARSGKGKGSAELLAELHVLSLQVGSLVAVDGARYKHGVEARTLETAIKVRRPALDLADV
jgi:hypothetical protein